MKNAPGPTTTIIGNIKIGNSVIVVSAAINAIRHKTPSIMRIAF